MFLPIFDIQKGARVLLKSVENMKEEAFLLEIEMQAIISTLIWIEMIAETVIAIIIIIVVQMVLEKNEVSIPHKTISNLVFHLVR